MPPTSSEAPKPPSNCWTCEYDTEDHFCRLAKTNSGAYYAAGGPADWTDATIHGDDRMPPRDADGCPGYTAKGEVAPAATPDPRDAQIADLLAACEAWERAYRLPTNEAEASEMRVVASRLAQAAITKAGGGAA